MPATRKYKRPVAYKKTRRTKKTKTTRRTKKGTSRKVSRKLNKSHNGMDVVRGRGSYIMGGAASAMTDGTSPPIIKNTGNGEIIIRHREYLGDMLASQAFGGYAYSINPGLSTSFPWLSNVAANFEEWEPRGMLYEYKTTSSDSVVSTNANASLGTVSMATEYNPLNGAFANKQQMENYEFACSCKPSQNMLHQVETAGKENPLKKYYVRTGPVPTNADIRFYDLGLFQIASSGMQSNANAIGEIWCTYEIALRKPRIQVGLADNATATDHFTIPASTIVPTAPFGTATSLQLPNTGSSLLGALSAGVASNSVPVLDTNGNPTGAFGNSIGNSYYFPPGVSRGTYLMYYVADYTGVGTAPAYSQSLTNCQVTPLLYQNTVSGFINDGTTPGCVMWSFFVTVTKANARVGVATTGGQTNPLFADLFIVRLPDGIK